jgi:hypothetical protein
MKVENLQIGMKVRHPAYGAGEIRGITEHTVEVLFEDGRRTISPESGGLQPAEPQASIAGLDIPLDNFIKRITRSVIDGLGLEPPDSVAEQLGPRWNKGTLIIKSGNESIQPKEVPLETFFHKIVMMRNNLRVLEQKINSNDRLNDGDKVELQQYITKCYGSMTTFNVLFRNKDDGFTGAGSE